MKNIFVCLTLLSLMGGVSSYAQDLRTVEAAVEASQEEISVVRFQRLPNDITARVTAPKRDQNNEPCAIIKVVTKDKSLFFEPDALGITAREDKPGEIWLYVPHGARRITIKHERFGVIRNFFYDEPIDKSTVYELLLHVPQSKTAGMVVHSNVTEQALMMNYSPIRAKLYIDDELQRTTETGAFSTSLPLGKHRYRLEAPRYQTEEVEVDIVPEHPIALNINMKPLYGFINATANKKSATLLLNGKKMGKGTFQSDSLDLGNYVVRAERKWYIPQEKQINLTSGSVEEVQIDLKRCKPNLFLLAQMGNRVVEERQNSFGVMVGYARKFGGYLSMRTNGSPQFSITDNGVSNPTGAYTGEYKHHHFTASVGAMARIIKPLYVYVGVGYLWHSIEAETFLTKEYQLVEKNQGRTNELGLIGRYKNFVLSAAVSSDFNFYNEAVFGIGYVFGR